MRAARVPVLLIALLACGSETKANSTAQVDDEAGPSPSSTASARPTQSAPTRQAPLPKEAPETITGAIRENISTAAFKDGAAFEARMFVSKLTRDDGVHLAVRFKLEKPVEQEGPLTKATMDSGDLLRSLKFTISSPSGTTILETSDKLGRDQLSLAWFNAAFTINGSGVTRGRDTAPWKNPVPDLFAKAGTYSIAISGQLKMSTRTITIALKPLAFEIVEVGPAFKTLADLSRDAASLVELKRGLAKPPVSRVAVIDDVDDNRWFRFQTPVEEPGHSRSEVEIHELLLDPAGNPKNYDVYLHFTCVAEGTKILTPTGETPIEKLAIGDSVVSYDPATHQKNTSRVEQLSASHAEHLVRLGDLVVTGAHPIFADGRFTVAADLAPASRLFGADGTTKLLSPVAFDMPATVFDLSVSAPHTYFAGGLLVHNKSKQNPVGGDDLPYQGNFYRRAVKR